MANQFNAKIRFVAIAWRAFDARTRAWLTVIDNGGYDVKWALRTPDGTRKTGTSASPSAARSFLRALCEKLPEVKA